MLSNRRTRKGGRGSNPQVMHMTDPSQFKKLLAMIPRRALTVILVYSPGCPHCHTYMPIWKEICTFVKKHPHSKAFRALGSRVYLSCMREADGVVGNSSSGLLEAPVLKKPVVNIGERQRGRLAPANVVSCPGNPIAIRRALTRILSKNFRHRCADLKNPFGSGSAAQRIVARLRSFPDHSSCQKRFYDLTKTT